MSDSTNSPQALTEAMAAASQSLQLAGAAMAASDHVMAIRRMGELQVALVEAFAAASDISAVLLAVPAAFATTTAPVALH